MTATTATTRPTTSASATGSLTAAPHTPLRALAGGALVAGTVLFAAGLATSPPQDSEAKADYIASLARDETLTEVSALLLHYGNLAMGVGVLAAATLVRGRRGARLTLIGSLLAALAFLNTSGLIFADWWNMTAGRQLTPEQAVALFEGVYGSPLFVFWTGTEPLALLGPVLLLAGLARAGVLRWFHAPWFVGGVAALFAMAVLSPVLAGALVLIGFWPLALIGIRLVQRHRAGC